MLRDATHGPSAAAARTRVLAVAVPASLVPGTVLVAAALGRAGLRLRHGGGAARAVRHGAGRAADSVGAARVRRARIRYRRCW